MGFLDYFSRSPDKDANSVSKKDEELVVAQINGICRTFKILPQKNVTRIKHRGRPPKFSVQQILTVQTLTQKNRKEAEVDLEKKFPNESPQ